MNLRSNGDSFSCGPVNIFVLGTAVLMLGAGLLAQSNQERVRQEETRSYYEKWLDEDVTYIISDQERSVFTALRMDFENWTSYLFLESALLGLEATKNFLTRRASSSTIACDTKALRLLRVSDFSSPQSISTCLMKNFKHRQNLRL